MNHKLLIAGVIALAVLMIGCATSGDVATTDDNGFTMVEGRRQYQVPRAQAAVTVDGVIDAEQWGNALAISANHADFVEDGIGSSIWNINMGVDADAQAPRAEGTIRLQWTDEGLYIAVEMIDSTPTNYQPFGGQSNIQDAVQFAIDPDFRRDAAPLPEVYIIDLSMSNEGEVYWYEYFQYGGHDPGAGIVTAGGPTSDGWVAEAFIPWDAIRAAGETFVPAAGLEMGLGILICDFAEQGTLNDLYWDFGNMVNTIDQPGTWNSIVLVD